MAKVEMPLEELRELEGKVESANKRADGYKEAAEKINEELIKLQSSKSIVKKTITIYEGLKPAHVSPSDARQIAESVAMELGPHVSPSGSSSSSSANNYNRLMSTLIRALDRVRVYPEAYHSHTLSSPEGTPFSSSNTQEKVEYINFDDVQRELREKVEESVAKELGELREKVKSLITEHASEETFLREENREKRENLDKQYQKVIEKKDEAYLQLQREYIALQEDKDMRTTEQKLLDEIQKLKEELALETGKPWWKKLFGA